MRIFKSTRLFHKTVLSNHELLKLVFFAIVLDNNFSCKYAKDKFGFFHDLIDASTTAELLSAGVSEKELRDWDPVLTKLTLLL